MTVNLPCNGYLIKWSLWYDLRRGFAQRLALSIKIVPIEKYKIFRVYVLFWSTWLDIDLNNFVPFFPINWSF